MRLGHTIALTVLSLLTIGVVMVTSARMEVAPVGELASTVPGITAESIILSRQTAYMGLALAAMTVGAFLPIRRFADRAVNDRALEHDRWAGIWSIIGIGLALLALCGMAYLPMIGKEVNGSHRWLRLPIGGPGGLSVQPSEIAKWVMIPVVAWYVTVRARVMGDFFKGLFPILAMVGIVAGFIILEDLGTGALIAGVAAILLLAGGGRIWQLALLVPLGLAGLSGAILVSDYRRKRILAFLDPFEDSQGIGYHIVQSLITISEGRGWGRGLGGGLNKFGYLPEDWTDFLFPVICEELGISGAAVVIVLFAVLVIAGMLIAWRESNPLLRLWSLGIVATIGGQAVFNLMVVTALAPTKGIALPLLSSGGTGWILTAFSLGVLIAIDRTAERAPGPIGDPHAGPLATA